MNAHADGDSPANAENEAGAPTHQKGDQGNNEESERGIHRGDVCLGYTGSTWVHPCKRARKASMWEGSVSGFMNTAFSPGSGSQCPASS